MQITGHGRPLSSLSGLSGSSVVATPDAKVLEALSRHIPPEQIEAALAGTGGRRKRRNRKIPAAAAVWLVIAIGLWGEADVPSLWRQVVGTMTALWQAVAGLKPPCKSALSQARSRLGARPLRRLFKATAAPLATGPLATTKTRGATYKAMPLKAMDGDDYTLPDTPDNVRAFGKPRTGRDGKVVSAGYPQVHLTRLIEVGTRFTLEALIKPQHFNDHPSAPALLAKCSAGNLVLWDCGFHSYRLIEQAVRQGTFMLGPAPDHAVFKPLRHLSDGSYLAKIYPSPDHRKRDEQGIVVRVIEYTFNDPNRPGHGERHRLITTLLDAQQYPADELIVLYHQRWEIEIANDEITTHQIAPTAGAARATELRSKTPCGVVQELYGVLLAHNAVRALMHEAAMTIDVDPRKLSFCHAVRVVRDTVPLMRAAPTCALPILYAAMIRQISLGLLPPRDGRINPRVIKVKMSNWPKKRPAHYHVPQPIKPFAASIVMLN
jgi:Insertion element 4 transposase N-terminal/Transposase DDE domain